MGPPPSKRLQVTNNKSAKRPKKEKGPNVLQKKAQWAYIKKNPNRLSYALHIFFLTCLQKKAQWASIEKAQSAMCYTFQLSFYELVFF